MHDCEDKDAVLLHNGSMHGNAGVHAWEQWHASWGI